jgi:hypothetical protein
LYKIAEVVACSDFSPQIFPHDAPGGGVFGETDMIWWAYAGLSGAIVLSLVFIAWIVGVPANALMQLAVATASVMLIGAMVVSLTAAAFRRRPRHSR